MLAEIVHKLFLGKIHTRLHQEVRGVTDWQLKTMERAITVIAIKMGVCRDVLPRADPI